MHFEKLHKRCPPILTSPVPCRTHASTLAGKHIYSKTQRSAARVPFRKVVALRLNGVADACASQRRESRRCRACARPARPRRLANRTASRTAMPSHPACRLPFADHDCRRARQHDLELTIWSRCKRAPDPHRMCMVHSHACRERRVCGRSTAARVVSQHIRGLVVMLVKVSSELNTGMGKVLLAVRNRAMNVFLLLPFTGFEGRRSLIAASGDTFGRARAHLSTLGSGAPDAPLHGMCFASTLWSFPARVCRV